MVMNHYDSAFNRHPNPARGCAESVNWNLKGAPFCILDVVGNALTIFFGQSHETSDFIVDCLESWWHDHAHQHPDVEELAINLDNGPAVQSHRTQFIRRMVEFSHKTGLRIVLIYYPPYHSKYNPIERCWAALENYWNGAILSTVDT